MQDARKKSSTVKNSRLECPHCKQSTPIEVIRRHLRLWENDDLIPRPDDVFQERLYCIRWCLPNLEYLLCIEQILQDNDSEDYGGWTLIKARTAIDSLRQFVTNEASNQIAVARVHTWPSEAHLLLNALAELKDLGIAEKATSTERLEAIRELGRARKALPSEVQPIIEISKNIPESTYCAPTAADFTREQKVLDLLQAHFHEWQEEGYLPSRSIVPGDETARLMRERGWTHWHHLFNPRQLLVLGTLMKQCIKGSKNLSTYPELLLGVGRCADYNARLSRWHPRQIGDKSEQTFSNQALNTLYTYAARTIASLDSAFFLDLPVEHIRATEFIGPMDSRSVTEVCNLWITDPPYADAINYHELSEFFLSWYENPLQKLFPNWYTDSKRALAITGSNEIFRKSMVDCYRNLAAHMPDDGLQIVMFTHQNASVWADLALILWASGLRVTAAWTIATETESALKEGNYVQGTVLLVLRKQIADETTFLDEIYPQVEHEVKSQFGTMLVLDDQEDPNFGDTDYQLAAYAAALRVLTQYKSIEEIDVTYELAKTRKKGEVSPVEAIIANAVNIACDYLVPQGFDTFAWKTLLPDERFYLKGLDLESHGEYRAGAYQELARGFGVKDYQPLLSSDKANQTHLKTATEFGSRLLGHGSFGASLVRHALFAIREVVRTDEVQPGKNWLRTEVSNYWQQRKILIELLHYFSTMGLKVSHWRDEARASQLLAGAVENDSI